MRTLRDLTLCVLLWAQTVILPSPEPPEPEQGKPFTVTPDHTAKMEAPVMGRCPVHGILHLGEVFILYSPGMKRRHTFCLYCIEDLLLKELPKVEEAK